MLRKRLEKFLKDCGEPSFRLKQAEKAIFQNGIFDFSAMTVFPKNLREKLKSEVKIFPFEMEKFLQDTKDQSAKALLKLSDGNFVETVLISPKVGDWSVCVSCQVGCPLACRFCATGKNGFKRNLTAEEISGQVLFWMKYLRCHSGPAKRDGIHDVDEKNGSRVKPGMTTISNIVFMGMGEPMLNWENVAKALEELHNPETFNFGWRSLSVSTAGIPEGIEKMANKFPQVNLAVSLHFADDEKRSVFMPINIKYNLEELSQALRKYLLKTNRKIFVEYVMLSEMNDNTEDAKKLIKYLKSFRLDQLIHVNLITYNQTEEGLKASSQKEVVFFKNYLIQNGIETTIRKSLGGEIEGACGQLAGKDK